MSKFTFLSKISQPLLFAIILWIAYGQKDTIFPLLQNIKINWLLAGIFFYFCNYVARACRLQLLVGKQHFPFRVGLKTASLHGFYSYFLPFRSGDISLPLLLRKFADIPFLNGSSILLRARLLDMFSLGIILFCSTLSSFNILDIHISLLFLLASMVLLGTPSLVYLALSRSWNIHFQWIKLLVDNVSQCPISYRQTNLSLLIWFWTGCTLFSATRALSIPIHFMDIWFLVAIQLPLQLCPIQGIANTGNHEIGWVTGFTLLGISAEKGLEFSLASHVIIIFYVIILGIIGFFIPIKKLIHRLDHNASE